MSKAILDYVHRDLKEEVLAIGGHYRFTDEVRLLFEKNELLYLKGYAVFDTTCCGAGGCSYVLVQGIIEQWKIRKDSDGFFVSRVRPVEDKNLRDRLTRLIKEKEMVQQVRFV